MRTGLKESVSRNTFGKVRDRMEIESEPGVGSVFAVVLFDKNR